MKKYIKHIAIISFLAIAQIGAFTLKAHAQLTDSIMDKPTIQYMGAPTSIIEANWYYPPINHKPEKIADETTIYYGNKTATIECDNEDIAQKLLRRYDQIIKRAAWGYKKDRHGSYKHYIIVVGKEDANLIKEWAKNNL